ncbi:hypothetical protein QYE76_052424 [Lolium multiflorum]|uniref:Reverse transcriptase Ty1/copia-type domain-containing protein n=1 Tax=Lolium multiflorum TaxID=4521 RepID=A0AAD8SUP6_LOLMU|nr:hypothetical protein QYE76_052424 [Lolium multiflorum]
MQEELNNFKRNDVWTLMKRPDHCRNVIGTKWVFKNKQDEHGIVIRNKARFVAQGYSQVEGMDFGETFAPVRDVNDGGLKYFLGFEIKQMRQGTFINQAKYVQDMLKRFDMKGANGIGTPMHLKCQLTLDETGKAVDPKLYRSMIGSLLYLCASRPDIMLSVGMCARFQANPKKSHIMAVKRIFRYLVDTPNFGLWYPRDTDFSLVGFTNLDWAGDKLAPTMGHEVALAGVHIRAGILDINGERTVSALVQRIYNMDFINDNVGCFANGGKFPQRPHHRVRQHPRLFRHRSCAPAPLAGAGGARSAKMAVPAPPAAWRS